MKMHELLSDKSKWTQDHIARDVFGLTVGARSASACCWCLIGAVEKCYGYGPAGRDAMTKLRSALGYGFGFVSTWNDQPERKFEEVRELLLKLDI